MKVSIIHEYRYYFFFFLPFELIFLPLYQKNDMIQLNLFE